MLFILIGLFGAKNKIRAGYYIFLYTLLGSLFLLLAILKLQAFIGIISFEYIFKVIIGNSILIVLFCGIFIAFAVKTPLYGLNSWLLKAHTESPLGVSIILAAIVLKLSLYGIFRLILPLTPIFNIVATPFVFVFCVITIFYASLSTLRTTDIKAIVAYSSVGHAAIYLIGAFSNTIQGIEGSVLLGLGHGLVSPGLFIIVGGVLYDRSGTRDIAFYRGSAQMMPILSTFFLILILANCGAPLTLNFVGEFLCLYGSFVKLPLLGVLASSSIVLSAAYSVYLFNRVVFGGSFSKFFQENPSDLTKREFLLLFILAFFTVLFGVYPIFILDGLHFNVSSLIYAIDSNSFYSSGAILLGVHSYSTTSKAANKGWNQALQSRLETLIQEQADGSVILELPKSNGEKRILNR